MREVLSINRIPVSSFGFLILFLLGIILIFQQLRLRALRRVLSEVAEAAENGYFPLFAIPERLLDLYHIRRINRVIEHLRRDQRQVEARYKSCAARAEAVSDSMREGLVIIGPRNEVMHCNRTARDRMGINEKDGSRIEMQVRSVSFLDLVNRVRKGKRIEAQEIQVQTDEGVVWYEVTGMLVRNDDTFDMLLIFNDITRLQALEAVRRDFVADVSHELRTPLTIIRGFAQALDADYTKLDEEKRQRFFKKILRNVERLSALVEDLLSLSRLEAGHTALNLTHVDIKALVQTILEDYRERIGDGSDPFESILPDEPVFLLADPMQIGQVLRNLLDNAIRYAETYTYIRVHVRITGDGKFVLIEVEDDGVGVSRQDTDRIFQRFYRVDKGRSRDKGGTGLGLSIVKHAVQLHGGRVEASSFPGKGLRVTCRFPFTGNAPTDSRFEPPETSQP